MLRVVVVVELKPLTFMWLLNQTVFPEPIDVPLKLEVIMLTASARATDVRASNIVADAAIKSSFRIIFLNADERNHQDTPSVQLKGEMGLTSRAQTLLVRKPRSKRCNHR